MENKENFIDKLLSYSAEQYLKLGCLGIIAIGIVAFIISGIFSAFEEEEAPQITSCVEAIKKNDFKRAHELLDRKLESAVSNASTYAVENYWNDADVVYKAEMMYLINLKDKQANDRLIYELSSMVTIGEKPQQKSIDENLQDYSSLSSGYNAYCKFVSRYNRNCDEILDIAIRYKNKDMAERIVKLYKEDCIPTITTETVIKKGTWSDKEKIIEKTSYAFTNDSFEKAKKKFNQAVKEGEFN